MKKLTKSYLKENPISLLFLMSCKAFQHKKNDKASFLYIPNMAEYEQYLSQLENYIFFLKNKEKNTSGRAFINMQIAEFSALIEKTAIEYCKKVSYDIKKIVEGNFNQKIKIEIKLHKHLLSFFYNGQYVGMVINPLDFFQEEKNQAIAKQITEYIKCYQAAEDVVEKSDFLEINTSCGYLNVVGYMFSQTYTFDSGDYQGFLLEMQKLDVSTEKMNQAHQQILSEFEGLEIINLKICSSGCKIKFKGIFENKVHTVSSKLYDIKSAANRAKSMVSVAA